jgi:(4S)-4-hydroxy-5-phosphonooxypentane-2,3-dione isomerase
VLAKVILKGHIIIPDSNIDVVINELDIHKRLTLQESGCLTFTVTPDAVNSHRFNVYEEFENKAAFDYHQARVKLSKWGEVTKNVGRHYQIIQG